MHVNKMYMNSLKLHMHAFNKIALFMHSSCIYINSEQLHMHTFKLHLHEFSKVAYACITLHILTKQMYSLNAL